MQPASGLMGGMHHLNHYSVIREYGVGCVPCREAAGDSLSGLSFQFRGPRPCHMRGLSDDTELKKNVAVISV